MENIINTQTGIVIDYQTEKSEIEALKEALISKGIVTKAEIEAKK